MTQVEDNSEEKLHQEARALMEKLSEDNNRDANQSLDEFLEEYRETLTQGEIDEIQSLLNKFYNL